MSKDINGHAVVTTQPEWVCAAAGAGAGSLGACAGDGLPRNLPPAPLRASVTHAASASPRLRTHAPLSTYDHITIFRRITPTGDRKN